MMFVVVLLLCRYISHPLWHDVRIHDYSLLKMQLNFSPLFHVYLSDIHTNGMINVGNIHDLAQDLKAFLSLTFVFENIKLSNMRV